MTNKSNNLTLKLKLSFVLLLSLVAAVPAWACTSLLVGKNASTDGSTMITYAADAHVLDRKSVV